MKFINVKNLISYLFFLISPFLGLISSFLNIALSKNRKCFYLILSAFTALFFVKRPPLHDLYRYYLHFSEIENFSDVGLKDGYYLFDLISLLFSKFEIPFYFLSPLFVFLSLYLVFISLERIILYYHLGLKSIIFLVFSVVCLINPVSVSMGLRSYLSFSLLFYGLVLLYLSKSNKAYIYFLLASLAHTSIIAFVFPVLVAKYFNINKYLTITLSLFFLFFNYLIVDLLVSNEFIGLIFGDLLLYTEFDNLENKSENGLLFYYSYLFYKLFFIYFVCIFAKNKIQSDFEIKIYSYLSLTILISSISSVSEIALGRYTSYSFFIAFILIFLLVCKDKSLNYTRVFIYFCVFLNFFVLNIYIHREYLVLGDSIEMLFISPLNIFLYDLDQYNLFLNNVDSDGNLKK